MVKNIQEMYSEMTLKIPVEPECCTARILLENCRYQDFFFNWLGQCVPREYPQV